MKRIIAIAALCACLSACTQGSIDTASTRAVIGADGGFQAASAAGEDAVKLGKMDKATYKDLNQRGHDALIALRLARQAGNASDITTASANLALAVAAIYAAVKGN